MTKTANFDSIARVYRWLEYFSFGPYLECCRFEFLPRLAGCRRALVLGDGDGRFTARLLAANRDIAVGVVDASGEMLRLLDQRVRALGIGADSRLTLHHADALRFARESIGREDAYDLVATHFFLDCFSDEQVNELIRHVRSGLSPGAVWVVSEFAIPRHPPLTWIARLVVSLLYRAFGAITGLGVRRLPDYAAALGQNGFTRCAQKSWLGGLLVSELWIQATRTGARDSHIGW